jgi:hypothetical protein
MERYVVLNPVRYGNLPAHIHSKFETLVRAREMFNGNVAVIEIAEGLRRRKVLQLCPWVDCLVEYSYFVDLYGKTFAATLEVPEEIVRIHP